MVRIFAMPPEDEELLIKQQESYAVFAQIEAAVDHRNELLLSEIKGLKTLE